jgi:uncharacterized protein YbaR (Trm112 family)
MQVAICPVDRKEPLLLFKRKEGRDFEGRGTALLG